MTTPEKEIQVRNLEAESTVLRTDIDERTKELVDILSKIDTAKLVFDKLEKEKEAFGRSKVEQISTLTQDRANFEAERVAYEKHKESEHAVLDQLGKDINAGHRELSRINMRCVAAQEDLDGKESKIKTLEQRILDLTGMAEKLSIVESQFATIIEQKGIFEADCSQKLDIYQQQVEAAKIELVTIQGEKDAAISDRDQALYHLKSYTDQLYTNMNDYQIVRARLERVFKEHYPELELPLAKE